MEKIEAVKSYWDKRPCNIRHSQEIPGTKEFYDQIESKKYFVEPHLPKFADFEKWKGKKVLEVGCGLGGESVNFARHGAEVTSIDISEKSLELAKKRAEVFGLTNKITFYHGNAEKLCDIVPIERYALIWSFGVIHHSPRPLRIIRSIKALMWPETELRIMLYHKFSWKVFWILMKFGKGAFWKLDKLIAQYSEAQLGCPVTYAYSKKEVKKLLCGMKIKDIQIEHIFSYKFPEYKDNVYKRVWYFRRLPKKVFHWLEKRIGWHMCVTAIL